MASLEDIYWAAGLFEGEGCISGQWAKRSYGEYFYPRFQLVMCDFDVVARFRDVVGGGQIHVRPRKQAHHKHQFAWHKMGWEFFDYFGDLLLPRLGERRQARYAEVAGFRT